MYLAVVILLMGVLPLASIVAEFVLHAGADPVFLVGKWFVFWSVGVRLILAGVRQVASPTFTAEAIFGVKEKAALTIVQELGFGNLSIGLLGLLTLIHSAWIVPAAIAGGLFYALAGIKHLTKGERNGAETIAMISDLFIAIVLAGYLAALALGRV
jgi:hypothetical protein